MSIDYREYFAGSCFGAVALSGDTCSPVLMGDDIDVELDEHIDEELFGATAKGNSLRRNFSKNAKYYQALCLKARKQHAKCCKLRKSPRHSKLLASAKRDLDKIKLEMVKGRRRLVAQWRKLDNKFKKHWAKKHNKSFAAFLREHGPHQFQ